MSRADGQCVAPEVVVCAVLVPNKQCVVLQCTVLQHLVCCAWCIVWGAWCVVCNAWCMVCGAQCVAWSMCAVCGVECAVCIPSSGGKSRGADGAGGALFICPYSLLSCSVGEENSSSSPGAM